jgi:hypothetical protein
LNNYSASSIDGKKQLKAGLTILARIIVRQVLEKQNQEAVNPQIEIEKGMEKEYAAICNE